MTSLRGEQAAAVLAARLGLSQQDLRWQPVGGGSIHHALCLQQGGQKWFLKYNHSSEAPNFAAEAAGLQALSEAKALACPAVLDRFSTDEVAFLVLDWVEQGPRQPQFWQEFGEGLANLHRHHALKFGWHADNFIGRLPQYNNWEADFPSFFWTQRIAPRLKEARDRGLLDGNQGKAIETLCSRMGELVPFEPPSLLHGDLWSGNFLCNQAAKPILIDPAVHFGHRESELAFTRLFGGFAPDFYQAYQAAYPMQPGWENRADLLNLYPLMVHLVLFGRSYLPDVLQILASFA